MIYQTKATLDEGIVAALAGADVLVALEQAELNIGIDVLLSLPHLCIKGGLVIIITDDPTPSSSQGERSRVGRSRVECDTRQLAAFIKVPVLDPSTPQEASRMVHGAFDLSQRYLTPVIVRLSARVCRVSALLENDSDYAGHSAEDSPLDTDQATFSSNASENRLGLNEQLSLIATSFCTCDFNSLHNTHATAPPHQGIIAGGISYIYLLEASMQQNDLASDLGSLRLLKLGTPFPFPEKLVLEFLEGLREVLVFEEQEPVIERKLLQLVGKHQLKAKVYGKLSGHTGSTQENPATEIASQILKAFGCDSFPKPIDVNVVEW